MSQVPSIADVVPEIAEAEAQGLRVQLVDPKDWPELLKGIPPFDEYGFPNSELAQCIGAFAGEQLVATWWISITFHVEPLWIHPDHRKRPGLIRGLWRKVHDELVRWGAEVAFGVITEPTVMVQAERLGFSRAPGDLWFIKVQKEE